MDTSCQDVGYKFDAPVVKVTNMIEDDLSRTVSLLLGRKIGILDWNIGFLNAFFSVNFE